MLGALPKLRIFDIVKYSWRFCLRGFFNLSFGANLLLDPPGRTMERPGDRISAQADEPLNVES